MTPTTTMNRRRALASLAALGVAPAFGPAALAVSAGSPDAPAPALARFGPPTSAEEPDGWLAAETTYFAGPPGSDWTGQMESRYYGPGATPAESGVEGWAVTDLGAIVVARRTSYRPI